MPPRGVKSATRARESRAPSYDAPTDPRRRGRPRRARAAREVPGAARLRRRRPPILRRRRQHACGRAASAAPSSICGCRRDRGAKWSCRFRRRRRSIIFSAVPEESGGLEQMRPNTRLILKPFSLVMLVETLQRMIDAAARNDPGRADDLRAPNAEGAAATGSSDRAPRPRARRRGSRSCCGRRGSG